MKSSAHSPLADKLHAEAHTQTLRHLDSGWLSSDPQHRSLEWLVICLKSCLDGSAFKQRSECSCSRRLRRGMFVCGTSLFAAVSALAPNVSSWLLSHQAAISLNFRQAVTDAIWDMGALSELQSRLLDNFGHLCMNQHT